MSFPFQVSVSDPRLAQQFKHAVQIGHYFVFVEDAGALNRSGRLGRLLGYRASERTVLPLIDKPVELSGFAVSPPERSFAPVGALVSDRDLYRAGQDLVRLLVAVPKPVSSLRVEVKYNGAPLTERSLSLDAGGMTVETLTALLPGSYSAQLFYGEGQELGPAARFTVAEYSLAPLSGRLLSHRLDRRAERLDFDLFVESYQLPYDRQLEITLMDRDRAVSAVRVEASAPGRYSGRMDLEGEGPFRLALSAVQDSSRSAEVVIPGSRKVERELTVISELGREILFSLMPEPGAIPIRGGYISEGDTIATPLVVEEVVAERGRLKALAALESLTLAVLDVVSGTTTVIEAGSAQPGQEIFVDLPGPVCTVFCGCFVSNRPFEGYTSFFKPQRLGLLIDAPKTVRPKGELVLTLKSAIAADAEESPLAVLLSIRDERLTATDTPEVALAAAAKRSVDRAVAEMAGGYAFVGAAEVFEQAAYKMVARKGHAEDLRPTGAPPPPSDIVLARAPMAASRRAAAPRRDTGEWTLNEVAGDEMYDVDADEEATGEVPLRGLVLNSPASFADDLPDDEDAADGAASEQRAAPPALRARRGAPEAEPAVAPAPLVRSAFPEVLFYGLVPVHGEERVVIPVGDSLSTYTVEAFALTGGDWQEVRTTVTVDQPVRIDLDLPPAVHPEDRVIGKLRASAAGGQLRVRVLLDGAELQLASLDGKIVTAEAALPSPIELGFPLRPGKYRAEVEDLGTGETDAIEKEVAAPGKFRSYVRSIALLGQGGRLTLDSEGALSLRLLPALDEPFQNLLEATAGYSHLCCEQTGAKIVAASFMLLTAKEVARRRFAEEIVMSGIAREKEMWRRGKGFAIYPERSDVYEHYSRLVVRYLWSLHQLDQIAGVSPQLRRSIQEGIELADHAAAIHGMSRVPARVEGVEDAYAVATGAHAGRRGEAREFVRQIVDCAEVTPKIRTPSSPSPRSLAGMARAFLERVIDRGSASSAGLDPVSERQILAYAGATLLAVGENADGVRVANRVTREFNEGGRLYSTLDSVAAIALMIQLDRAGVGKGGGTVVVNGRSMSNEQAIELSDQVESVEVADGVAMVEVLKMKEEDWASYGSSLPVTVGFRDRRGQKQTRFRAGDRADLVVSLPDGYRAGDLLHVSLPPSMAWLKGGGKVQRFSLDFEGQDELRVPVVVTAPVIGKQRFMICVRNMFEENRATSPGLITIDAQP